MAKKKDKRHRHKRELDALWRRDNALCWICVLLQRPYHQCVVNREDASRDHYPNHKSEGGCDDWTNIKLAHVSCNNWRGTKTIEEMVRDNVGHLTKDKLKQATRSLDEMLIRAFRQ